MFNRFKVFRALVFLQLALVGASVANAQVPEDGVSGFNYAYSIFVGTGAYQFNDSTIYIVSMPLEFDLVTPDYEQGKVGYRLLMPFSVGIANFDSLGDLPDLDLSDAQAFSVTPGIEVLIPIRPNWMLKPYMQAGLGWETTTSARSGIFGAGSRVRGWYGRDQRLLVGGEFLWARNSPNKGLPTSSFSRWGLGAEYKIPTDWYAFGRNLSFHGRILQYYFGNSVNFEEPLTEFKVKYSTEVGISFGVNPPIKILGYNFRQGGIGFERAGEYKAIKLFTTFPF
jgi:hypothetical protein